MLLTQAVEQFPDLTDAERTLLRAVAAGEIADYRSPNSAENCPQHAETWGQRRTIHAQVIRWLYVDREAILHIDPTGIYVLGAKIEGELDLHEVTIPFPLRIEQCAIPHGINLRSAKTRRLSFQGSALGHATRTALSTALSADEVNVNGSVALNQEFHAEGIVSLVGASITGILDCTGGTFHNPKGDALIANGVPVGGSVYLRNRFRAYGVVRLEGGRVGPLLDDKASWPTRGNLRLDGFVYTAIAEGPTDANARLAWLARQPSRPFRPQPYLQLAKVLRESGRESDAKRVLIAKERARRKYGNLGCRAWCWSWLLNLTIGYGYQPWKALIWAGGLVVLGGIFFGWGYDAGIVIPTKAEAYGSDKTTRQEPQPPFYPAFNRWFYALDTFVPIINFGQKDYWAPQGACNRSGLIRGGGIRLCVWGIQALYLYRSLHIVAGWVLITLVVTGFTNLVRRE